MRDIVIILEEGNLPHPRCPGCDMFVPWRALNGRHNNTEMCRSGVDRKQRRPWRRRMSRLMTGELPTFRERKREGQMWGLCKGGGGGVSGLPPHVAAWEGTGKALDMDGCGYWGGEKGESHRHTG